MSYHRLALILLTWGSTCVWLGCTPLGVGARASSGHGSADAEVAEELVACRAVGATAIPMYTSAAFDKVRQRLVVVGYDGTWHSRGWMTWEWDGTTWSQFEPEPAGQITQGAIIAFDEHVGAVRHIGRNGSVRQWDGARWLPIATNTLPGRDFMAAIYDPARGGLVLTGEMPREETSEARPYTQAPPPLNSWLLRDQQWSRLELAAEASRAQLVLNSADGRVYALIDWLDVSNPQRIWRLDRDAWTPIETTGQGPAPLIDTLCVGLAGPTCLQRDALFELNGRSWRRRPIQPPPASYNSYDPAGGTWISFGCSGDWGRQTCNTWRLVAGKWMETTRPPRRSSAAAYDEDRACIVSFGGYPFGGGIADDTWCFAGKRDRPISSPTRPRARAEHALAYDRGARRMMLFGGVGASANGAYEMLADTWVLTRRGWAEVKTAHKPPGGRGAQLVYDAQRKVMVLSSVKDGRGGGELWQFVAGDWAKMADTPVMTAAAYDASTQTVVLMEQRPWQPQLVLWDWDGHRLASRAAAQVEPIPLALQLLYDDVGQRLILASASRRTWTWRDDAWHELTGTMADEADSQLVRGEWVIDPKRRWWVRLAGSPHVASMSGTTICPAP